MKYIKMFEGTLNYKKVSRVEFNDLIYLYDGSMDLTKFESFTEDEIKMVMSSLPEFEIDVYDAYDARLSNCNNEDRVKGSILTGDNFDGILTANGNKVVLFDTPIKNIVISIMKLRDEWYTIVVSDHKSSSVSNEVLYKCDQLEGLREFLNDRINWFPS